jgi:uncharacterized protein (TIRG00374 family)
VQPKERAGGQLGNTAGVSAPANTGAGRRHRSSILRVAQVVIFFVVLYFLLPQVTGLRHSFKLISGLNPFLVTAAVVAEMASLVAYAQLTRSLLPPAGRPKIWTVMRIQVATMATGNAVPGGTAAAAPLGFHLFRQAGVSSADASFVLSAQPLGSALVLNLIFLVSLASSIPGHSASPAYMGMAFASIVFIVAIALLVWGIGRGSHFADAVVRVVARVIPKVNAAKVSAFLHSVVRRFDDLAHDRRLLLRSMGWAALQWLFDASSLWVFLAAAGVVFPPDLVLVAFGLANVSAAIPLTPGGVGVYEAVMVSALVGFGAPHAEAIVAVLGYRLFEFWLPIPLGLVAYIGAKARGLGEPDSVTPPSG